MGGVPGKLIQILDKYPNAKWEVIEAFSKTEEKAGGEKK